MMIIVLILGAIAAGLMAENMRLKGRLRFVKSRAAADHCEMMQTIRRKNAELMAANERGLKNLEKMDEMKKIADSLTRELERLASQKTKREAS